MKANRMTKIVKVVRFVAEMEKCTRLEAAHKLFEWFGSQITLEHYQRVLQEQEKIDREDPLTIRTNRT